MLQRSEGDQYDMIKNTIMTIDNINIKFEEQTRNLLESALIQEPSLLCIGSCHMCET